jgi:hypothetical protein
VGGLASAVVVNAPVADAATILYVAVNGTDTSNNCLVHANPCATITHAVNLAASGDTVQVGAGTFDESVVVNVPNLTIAGQGPWTVVTGPSNQPAFDVTADGTSLTMMAISSGGGDGVDNSGNTVSFVNDNIASNQGTGISNTGDNVDIQDDFIGGNNDGGVNNQGSTVTIADDTIFNNSASDSGGVLNTGTGVKVHGDTIDYNQTRSNPPDGAAGINSQGPVGSLSVGATILTYNYEFEGSANCIGPITDAGYNLEFIGPPPATSCGFSAGDHDITDQDPSLAGGAAWNGGPTQTSAIPPGSPVQGAIPSASPFCNGTDQRGAPRLQPDSTACDMGAFQLTPGYWEVASDGGIFAFGGATFFGSMGGQHLNAPTVGMADDPTSGGYWEVASDGGIFAFGAPFEGSMGGQHLNAPIVGMAANLKGGGYWEVASDGGIFAFGGAPFFGSMGGQHLNAPIMGMAADPSTGGYWLVAADGGIFSFGDANFRGSTAGQHLNAPIVGMAADVGGGGYWEVGSDGGIFNWNAPFLGSMGGQHLNAPIVGAAVTLSSVRVDGEPLYRGYWEVGSDGGIFAFGAPFDGSMGGQHLNALIVGMATG